MKSNHISEWITVSQEEINKPTSENKNGIKIHFMISPFDVPVATRAGVEGSDNEPGIYFLEFKYISDEKNSRLVNGGPGIQFEVGKNSRKIHKIMIDLSKFTNGISDSELNVAVSFNIDESLKDLESSNSSLVNSNNADAIRKIIRGSKGAEGVPVSPVSHHQT
ncbi:hypothetical protein [Pseudomonas sp.]|uniref:hypothetical protein n=1 Tax=Pseudomonas sp. TaxID=306 RepID=UPI0029B58EEA|nr:hypothetical protein [Pseudomonas sp.]MDX3740185.1 hypothetical protein [Pseudomonas sp.]